MSRRHGPWDDYLIRGCILGSVTVRVDFLGPGADVKYPRETVEKWMLKCKPWWPYLPLLLRKLLRNARAFATSEVLTAVCGVR